MVGPIAACGAVEGTRVPADGRIRVVATTTVFADLVIQVGGDRVAVTSLVPKGGEVHTFDPSPGDVARLAEADLIVANGLGLDDWVVELARDAGTAAELVVLANVVSGSDYILDGDRPNPHLWLDPALAGAYAGAIAERLGGLDPAAAATFDASAAAYGTRLEGLEDELHRELEAIPEERRRIVSFHDALPYLARAFDIEVVGSILEAPGQDPSAGELAELVDAIRDARVAAVVSEVQFSDELARAVAAETGARVVNNVYTDTLGDPPVDSYEGLLRWNVERLVEALR
jgi:manganese/iron transport system substrate-binding protein